jgi:predicted KAP-like P-loop ATPase
MFKPDQPIESEKDDVLDRARFAKSLAEAMLSYAYSDSVVTALYGIWGSGKSSVINMVVEHVLKSSANLTEEKKTIVLRFNPWNYSDQNQLVAQFFRELSTVLKRRDYGDDARKVGDQLEVYAKFFVPLALIADPTTLSGLIATGASKIFNRVGTATKRWGELKSKDLAATRREINQLLAKQQRKILIVIDDIDRLNNVEIRQIFQLVKALADFPNTVYLLAFDRTVVVNALKSVQEGAGEKYLEKIVQIPFELPEISKHDLEKLLFSQLDELLRDLPEGRLDPVYWGNIYHTGLKYFFNSVRDVTRYINSLHFSFGLVKNDVNLVDFLTIVALQVFEPGVYSGIRANKDVFAGVFARDYGSRDPAIEAAKAISDQTLALNAILDGGQLKDLLLRIFPKLNSMYGNTTYSPDSLRSWRLLDQVCSPDSFDTYFRLSIAREDISNAEIKSILSLASKKDAFGEALLKLKEDGRLLRFLDRIEDYTDSQIPEEDIEPIIESFMDLGDLFPEARHSMFGTDTPMRLLRLSYQLSHRFTDQATRFEIFKKVIINANRSLYTITHEIGVQCQQHGKYDLKSGQPDPEDQRTVNSEQLIVLEKLAREKIETWARDGRLRIHPKLVVILYDWRRWSSTEDRNVNAFVNELVTTDEGLITLIAGFVGKSYATGYGDYVSREEWNISLESLKEWVQISEIEPRIRAMIKGGQLERLTADQQRALNTFIDTVDGKKRRR